MTPDFHHVFVHGDAAKPVIIALHGTGADEHDLLPLVRDVAPGHAILSPRGKVLENGMNRFFKRHADGTFDLPDLHARADELAAFLAAACTHYNVADQPAIAFGFSNGANMAAAMMLKNAATFDGAVLLRAMVPFRPDNAPDLRGKRVLMLNGLTDPIIPHDNARTLADMLMHAGADVTFTTLPAEHGLIEQDVIAMKEWV